VELAKLCWWIGFLSAGCAFIPMNMVLRRLKQAGYNTGLFESWRPGADFARHSQEYLKIRGRFRWSALSVYLVWMMIAVGVIFIVLGPVLNHD
jgi:hypothetical protein